MNTDYLPPIPGEPQFRGAAGAAIVALGLVAAILLGVLASDANPLYVVMGVGLIAGCFLMAAPGTVIWLVLILSLPTGALISLTEAANGKFVWVVSVLSFLLWPIALLQLAKQNRAPLFSLLALLFVGVALTGTLSQWFSMAETAAGFKRYFQAYGLLFALAFLPFRPEDMERWKKFMLAMALLQLPFALYELFVLVPQRGGLEAGAESSDVVAGTFNANLHGGSSSAEMAAFLFIALAFLLARWQRGLIPTRRFLLLALACGLPLGLGETKIVIILIPLTAAVLLRKNFLRTPVRNFAKLLALGALTVGVVYVYAVLMNRTTPAEMFRVLNDYNFGARGYGDSILNRTTVYEFWWRQHDLREPLQFFFGHGLGSAYWTATNPIAGHVAVRFPHYGLDLTVASALLWDVGVAGLTLYTAIYVAAWVAANRVLRRTKSRAVEADALAIQVALAIFALYMVYDNSALHILPFQVIIAFVLGYLAYLYRQTVIPSAPDRIDKSAPS